MKKLTFLVFYKEYQEFLDRMGELGVLHVVQKQQGALDNAEVQEQMRLLSRYAAAIEALQKVEAASPNPSQGGELGSAMTESPLLGRGRGEATVKSNVNPPEVTGSGKWLYVEPLSGMYTHARHTKEL
jgi:hypothetical protein